MFSRASASASAHSSSSVTINQQPHDAADAARLLDELEAKAEKRWLDRMVLPLGGLTTDFTMVEIHRNPYRMITVVRVAFKLNGEVLTTDIELDDHEAMDARDRRIYAKIAEAITGSVINRVTLNVYSALNGGMK